MISNVSQNWRNVRMSHLLVTIVHFVRRALINPNLTVAYYKKCWLMSVSCIQTSFLNQCSRIPSLISYPIFNICIFRYILKILNSTPRWVCLSYMSSLGTHGGICVFQLRFRDSYLFNNCICDTRVRIDEFKAIFMRI